MTGLPQKFVGAILEWEEAAATLVEAKRAGSAAKAREGAVSGRTCTQLVIEAAEILASLGEVVEARAILKEGLRLDGPTAPLQHAYARHCRIAGDLDGASHWLKGAMLRARPNAAMALELCEIEYAREDRAAASDALALSVQLRWIDKDGLREAYRRLRQAGHDLAAIVPATMLLRRGEDSPELRRELANLMCVHAPCDGLPGEVVGALKLNDPMTVIGLAAASAHDALMSGFDASEVIECAERREAAGRWIEEAALWGFLKQRLDRGEPFSFVRMSDGEGRFVAALHRPLFPWFGEEQAQAVLRQIWMTWFGQDVSLVSEHDLRNLAEMFGQAMRNANLVGRTSAAMFEHDPRHFAYRAALDRWFDQEGLVPDQYHSDAAYNLFLNRRDPLLSGLLAGQGFIGAISPYDDLARRLSEQVGAARYRDYTIPGETRLGREKELSDRGTHFPFVFERIMQEIEVPFPGACFIVAGGLLGKIYCERIRQLGGIALDIGALADGWMGYNTRGKGFEVAPQHRLP